MSETAVNAKDLPARKSWADPGYFVEGSKVKNAGRLLLQLFKPPKGHRTVPTKTGLMLIMVTLGIGTAAFNTSHNILYLALALLLSSLLLSGLLSWFNFKGCRWRLLVPSHLRVGEPVDLGLEIRNQNKWLPIYSLWFHLTTRRDDDESFLPLKEQLDPDEVRRLDWRYTPQSRGVETVRLERLVSKFPFGFLRKTIEYSATSEVTVWPARIPYEFNPPGGVRVIRSGRRESVIGSGTELVNLRDYRHGDPMRRIHWKASARLRQLMVQVTAEENQEAYLLQVTTSSHVWTKADQFEKLCGFAATLAEDFYVQGRFVGMQVDNEPFHPVQRVADLHALLDRLAELEISEPDSRDQPVPLADNYLRVTIQPGAGSQVMCYIDGEPAGQA